MTENETFIYESIFSQVRMGFLSVEEIKENIIEEIQDNEFEDEISVEWANLTIENEFNTLINESENWKSPTDTQRLIDAFDALCEDNIIALHNAGYTTSDGECEVVEVELALRENQITSDGYCFYHEQDLLSAISPEDSYLYIAFQKIDNSDDNVTLAIGNKVVNVLKSKGFNVEWNETPTSKILIQNFKWQQLYNENDRCLQDYDELINLMSKNKSRNLDLLKETKTDTFWSKLKKYLQNN